MALEGVPWFVEGGAIHSGGIARALAYEASKGGNGVGGALDFKVTQTPTAGSNVRIATGNAFAVSRYAGVNRESYTTRALEVTDFPIPETGTGPTVTRYLVIRIDDPQFPGVGSPDSIENGPYVRPYLETVDPGRNGQNLPYPNVPLAKIVQPQNTATITDDMITNLRKIANPKQAGDTLVFYPTGSRTGGHQIPTAGYSSWPILSTQRPSIEVPEWATTIRVTGHFSGIWFGDSAGGQNDSVAGIRSGFAAAGGSENGILIQNIPASRNHYTVVGSHEVIAAWRGTSQLLNVQGVRTAGTGLWYADFQTSIAIDYLFSEQPI